MEMDDNLLELLVARLHATPSTRAIGRLLRSANAERALRPGDLHVSGNKEELIRSVRSGVGRGFISLGRLASLVAELEENGRSTHLPVQPDPPRPQRTHSRTPSDRIRHAVVTVTRHV